MQTQKNQKTATARDKVSGFTLLYAMLVVSAVVGLSAAILSVSMKELRLSGIGREASKAYYAAESGMECASYWALQTSSTYSCVGQSGPISSFTLNFPNGACAVVSVDTTNRVVTSRGYNTCIVGNPNRVERGSRSVY